MVDFCRKKVNSKMILIFSKTKSRKISAKMFKPTVAETFGLSWVIN